MDKASAPAIDPILVPVWPTGARAIGAGRTKMFELVATGAIETVTIGRKRLVAVEELRKYAERLRSDASPRSTPAA